MLGADAKRLHGHAEVLVVPLELSLGRVASRAELTIQRVQFLEVVAAELLEPFIVLNLFDLHQVFADAIDFLFLEPGLPKRG